ncbi:HAD family hydrolase [Mobilicoccus massiliensis]|uniref:hypothetical protein n=1 Tax=Mobilicoccus massiliensis TaxID=1522310 RepID=UPI00058D5D5B|nr:hypothetical protein [Mobilicoccus massiliensis]
MTAAEPGTWMPVEVRISPLRWWTAVLTGLASPLLFTPAGDLLPAAWRAGVGAALPLVAVICGLLPTLLRAGGSERLTDGRTPGGALVLAVALVLGLVAGVPLLLVGSDGSLLGAVGVATAAHLVAGRVVAGLLRVLPAGAHASRASIRSRPGASVPAIGDDETPADVTPGDITASAASERAPTRGAADLRRWVDLAAGWVAIPIGLLALLAFAAAWIRLAPQSTGGVAAIVATMPAAAVLLASSPAALMLARHVPGRAARDRGRELGIVFGDIDLRDVARISTLVFDPVGVVADSHPRLVSVRPAGRLQVTAALQAAASVAAAGDDPVHLALVAAARERGIPLRPVEAVPSPPGSHAAGTPEPLRGRIKDTVVTLGPAEVFERVPAVSTGEQTTVHVGWGGVARAAFTLLPQVRSQALTDRPELTALGITPVVVGPDPAVLRHIGEALEIPDRDRHVLTRPVTSHELVQRHGPPRADATAAVLLTGMLSTCGAPAPGDAAVVFAPGSPTSTDRLDPASGREHDHHTVHVDPGDLATSLRAVGLARKAGRVTTQGIVLVAVVEVLALGAAALGMLDPQYAAVVGAGLPVIAAANALRPRSYGRGDADQERETTARSETDGAAGSSSA